ncbi:hypothetical protein EVAR_52284_1 [Eumeta japonica]|uniref:Uncharacterized protein n=1 Tax=Eumeta variegata TaxID=151549 RepID=A0A4C1ZQU7_EUMVA|nr:hypothetical protein EVAR_52284_1 [Eumeta japonica]
MGIFEKRANSFPKGRQLISKCPGAARVYEVCIEMSEVEKAITASTVGYCIVTVRRRNNPDRNRIVGNRYWNN